MLVIVMLQTKTKANKNTLFYVYLNNLITFLMSLKVSLKWGELKGNNVELHFRKLGFGRFQNRMFKDI